MVRMVRNGSNGSVPRRSNLSTLLHTLLQLAVLLRVLLQRLMRHADDLLQHVVWDVRRPHDLGPPEDLSFAPV